MRNDFICSSMGINYGDFPELVFHGFQPMGVPQFAGKSYFTIPKVWLNPGGPGGVQHAIDTEDVQGDHPVFLVLSFLCGMVNIWLMMVKND